ncbi:hypothetical protein MJM04_32245, partial [Salmonella enterica subsp. enterica serovar Cerro]|nr:hypothetical protein [Salmonella enterica subsp. enterica serovar Cerro]
HHTAARLILSRRRALPSCERRYRHKRTSQNAGCQKVRCNQRRFREQWLADYYRLKRPDLKGWRENRAEQQQIIPVEVETLGRMW